MENQTSTEVNIENLKIPKIISNEKIKLDIKDIDKLIKEIPSLLNSEKKK